MGFLDGDYTQQSYRTKDRVLDKHINPIVWDIENLITDLVALNNAQLTSDQVDAIQGSNSPSASNPFATIDDIAGGALTPTTINAADLSETVATTLPIGGNFVMFYAELIGVTGTATALQIGIETDQPDLLYIEDYASDGVRVNNGVSLPSTAENRNIILTAIGGTFTAGTITIKSLNF